MSRGILRETFVGMHSSSGLTHFLRVAFFGLVGLLVIEGGLRLLGVGYEPTFFLDREDGHTVINHRFGRLFYPEELVRGAYPARFRTSKDAGVFRIFVLGESAAAGYPDPAFSASRILGARLERACPGKSFEVINTGVTALNSHAIRLIGREVTRYQPDAVIVYMGNNEVVGPFGPSSVAESGTLPVPVARALIAFRSTRTGQWLQSLADTFNRARRPPSWGGMEMFEKAQVAPDDPARAVTYRNFATNLAEIVSGFKARGVPVILCTIASNLSDCPPLGSLGSSQQNEAESTYIRGQRSLADRNFGQAQSFFRQARDADLLRFRADSSINNIIRDVAVAHGCPLVEAEEKFAAAQIMRAETDEPLFYEHVHFTFAGNLLLSDLWLEALSSVFGERMPCLAEVELGWADNRVALADALGYSYLARGHSIGTILGMLERPPFVGQSGHEARLSYWRAELREIEEQLTPEQLTETTERLQRLSHRKPADGPIAYWLGRHHEDRGHFELATAAYEQSLAALPNNPVVWLHLGDVYRRRGQLAEARKAYEEVARIFPADPISKRRIAELQVSSP